MKQGVPLVPLASCGARSLSSWVIAPQDPFHAFIMAKDRVEQRLHRATQALDKASIPYAVVGGNAVSWWVAQTNPAGTRPTKDVDLLVNRQHLGRITAALEALGFQRQNIRDFVLFLDPDEPDKRAGVHLVWAGERLRPSYSVPSPSVDEAARTPGGFLVVSLP